MSDFHPVALACPLAPVRVVAPRRGAAAGPFALLGGGGDRRRRSTSASPSRRWASGTPSATAPRARARRSLVLARRARRSRRERCVVVPHFAPAGVRPAFESRYDSPLARRARPVATSPSLLFPLALAAARRTRSRCSPRVPELGLNLLSSTLTQTSVKTHYAAVARSRRSSPRRSSAPRGWLAARVSSRALMATSPAMRLCSARSAASVLGADAHEPRPGGRSRVVPDGVPVSATNSLGAHLSDRRRIFSFPLLREAQLGRRRRAAADVPRQPQARAVEGRARASCGATRAWTRVFAEDGVLVFRRS